MPFFGIDVNIKNLKKNLLKIKDTPYKYLVNICSFIEIKWVIFHFIKQYPEKKDEFLKAYQDGLIFFTKSDQFELCPFLNIEIDIISNLVRDAGVQDYFDALIYATAKVYNAILITEDKLLHEISTIKNIENKVINWNTFIQSYF